MTGSDAGIARGEFDVAILGGALSGAATALLLKRRDPTLRVVVLEKNTKLKRRVGEATVEVSGYFLCRTLGLTSFLTQTQLVKNGLRFWFSKRETEGLGSCSEVGGKYLSAVPSFLVDRAVLDEEVLLRAEREGVDIIRPATVLSVHLASGECQTLSVRTPEGNLELRARWVVDASGVKCMLSRANGWWRSHQVHPTLSAWSRWRGVKDWDGETLAKRHPGLSKSYVGIRGTATNHLVGDGWWAWCIALKGGDTSIGVVIDQRRTDWPSNEEAVGEKLRSFISQHAAGREILEGAEFIAGDVHFRRNLPYHSMVYAGDGFVLTGDASAFLDPFYSPGMDWIAFTTSAAVRTILAWRRGEELGPVLQQHNRDFTTSYQRMFEALYENKYDYMGDYDLMRIVVRLDIALYYLFVVRPIFQDADLLQIPPYAAREAVPIFWLMRLYNRRFAAMGRKRRKLGTFGCRNNLQRDLFVGFNLRVIHLLKLICGSLAQWCWLEISEGWRSWGQRSKVEPSASGVVTNSLAQPAT
jgi:flavin-dependent dehydrogenase